MSEQEILTGGVFVAEWTLTDVAGAPATSATVVGKVTKPNGELADMVIDHTTGSNVYRASYPPTTGGRHGYKLTATVGGDPAGTTGGEFVVTADATGAAPIDTDPATDVGVMRLLVTDLDEAFPILTDAQYTAFLTLEGGNVKRGAAAALEAIATSETLRSKKITTQDLSVDGPAVADDLRKRAALLRGQADKADQQAAELAADPFGYGFDSVEVGGRSLLAGW